MAANKFATMLHKNTNKFTFVLVYAVLEWVLIILLFLNSLFSYLIIKFAYYFGLKRPCLWCSRIDHIFEPSSFRASYRSLVCEEHGLEISKLGFCSNHLKLAELQDMCEDCSSFPVSELQKKIAFSPWMKQLRAAQDNLSENGGEILKCSCCGVSLDHKLSLPDYFLIKPSWGDSDDTQVGNSVFEPMVDDKVNEFDNSDWIGLDFVSDRSEKEQRIDGNREVETEVSQRCSVSDIDSKETFADGDDKFFKEMEKHGESEKEDNATVIVDDSSCDRTRVGVQVDCSNDTNGETQPKHLEFFIDGDDCHLIPIDSSEPTSAKKRNLDKNVKGEEGKCENEDFVMEFDEDVGTRYELVMEKRIRFEGKMPLLPILENDEENEVEMLEPTAVAENVLSSGELEDGDLMTEEGNLVDEEREHVGLVVQATQIPISDGHDDQEFSVTDFDREISDNMQASEEPHQSESDDTEADISIGTAIPDEGPIDDLQAQEVYPYACSQEDPSTSNDYHHAYDDHCSKQAEQDDVEFRTVTVEESETMINNHLSLCSESNEIEEDKFPDTPTSIDGLHHLHKKLLLHDRRESGAEDSLDGSVISDIEAGGGVLTIEKLKSVLRDERKALNALYAELEEERSASAVAANQTMAMITRLQEEKAAMQMEALQYQRMMEEQAEYDQEALQLLNELMLKREKEKAELERELDIIRKKVQGYEAKEKMTILNRRKDGGIRSPGTSSATCSNAEDSDSLSVDMNHESREEDNCDDHRESINANTPVDAVLYLEESLESFEDERLSILEQLKVLEEKLFTLSDEEELLFEDVANGHDEGFDHSSEMNGVANCHHKCLNGKHHNGRKIIRAKAKRLLPLFDAAEEETEDAIVNGHAGEFDPISLRKPANEYDIDNKKLAIEEEVDHVYERLQALEADREFLRHCITSLRKGDKGVELLQEILHHLRDLRSVELRANTGDGLL